MDVDKELLQKVAEVARLELTDNELETFVPQFKEMLDYFSLIADADTKGVEPSFQPIPLKNRLREDSVVESLSQEDALKNSESKQDGYFKGPKAV